VVMALSQRSAARFFAAFYRWNLQSRRKRPVFCTGILADGVQRTHRIVPFRLCDIDLSLPTRSTAPAVAITRLAICYNIIKRDRGSAANPKFL